MYTKEGNMRYIPIFFCVMLLAGILAGNVSGGEIRRITLDDGSVITGEIISLDSGLFTIKSVSLGTLQIDDSKVRSINPVTNIKEEIQLLKQEILNNEELLEIILPLQEDPDFQRALADPSIMEAVESGDMDALLSNPDFLRLLNNPRILKVKEKMTE
jgi:hypothetical protein